ncbi:MAG TPA: ATP-binding protein, partial [Candidatus Paceibacterota bacterium]
MTPPNVRQKQQPQDDPLSFLNEPKPQEDPLSFLGPVTDTAFARPDVTAVGPKVSFADVQSGSSTTAPTVTHGLKSELKDLQALDIATGPELIKGLAQGAWGMLKGGVQLGAKALGQAGHFIEDPAKAVEIANQISDFTDEQVHGMVAPIVDALDAMSKTIEGKPLSDVERRRAIAEVPAAIIGLRAIAHPFEKARARAAVEEVAKGKAPEVVAAEAAAAEEAAKAQAAELEAKAAEKQAATVARRKAGRAWESGTPEMRKVLLPEADENVINAAWKDLPRETRQEIINKVTPPKVEEIAKAAEIAKAPEAGAPAPIPAPLPSPPVAPSAGQAPIPAPPAEAPPPLPSPPGAPAPAAAPLVDAIKQQAIDEIVKLNNKIDAIGGGPEAKAATAEPLINKLQQQIQEIATKHGITEADLSGIETDLQKEMRLQTEHGKMLTTASDAIKAGEDAGVVRGKLVSSGAPPEVLSEFDRIAPILQGKENPSIGLRDELLKAGMAPEALDAAGIPDDGSTVIDREIFKSAGGDQFRQAEIARREQAVRDFEERQRQAQNEAEQRKAIDDALKDLGGDDLVDLARTTEGKLKAGLDPNAFDSLGANLYANDLAKTIAKEGLQNAIDSVRPNGGRVFIYLRGERTIIFTDEGLGMSPDIIENQFLDIGGTDKPANASGGLGLAKVALFYNAEKVELLTVTDTPNGRVQSNMSFSGDDWIKGNIDPPEVTSVGPDVPTGTSISITVKPEAKYDQWQARSFLREAVKHSPAANIFFADQFTHGALPDSPYSFSFHSADDLIQTADEIFRETNEYYDVRAYESAERHEYRTGWDQIEIKLLNRGYYQSTYQLPYNGEGPKYVIVDVDSKVPTSDPNYPFTSNREQLKGPVGKAIEGVVKELRNVGTRRTIQKMVDAFAQSPHIKGTEHGRVIDTSLEVPKEFVERV